MPCLAASLRMASRLDEGPGNPGKKVRDVTVQRQCEWEYLDEIAEEVAAARADWDQSNPAESASVYQLHDPDHRFPRSDTLIGTTVSDFVTAT